MIPPGSLPWPLALGSFLDFSPISLWVLTLSSVGGEFSLDSSEAPSLRVPLLDTAVRTPYGLWGLSSSIGILVCWCSISTWAGALTAFSYVCVSILPSPGLNSQWVPASTDQLSRILIQFPSIQQTPWKQLTASLLAPWYVHRWQRPGPSQ